jgi:hypothetical protein
VVEFTKLEENVAFGDLDNFDEEFSTRECNVTPAKVELKLSSVKSTAYTTIILFHHCTNDVKTIIVKIQQVHTSHLSWESVKSRLPISLPL